MSCLLTSCSKEVTAPPKSDEMQHMERAARLVLQTLVKSNSAVTPANLQELKQLIKSKLKPDDLKEMGIDDVDKALTSTRDNQSYVLVPGVNIRNSMGPKEAHGGRTSSPTGSAGLSYSGPPIIMYEQKGSGGKHMVAYARSGAAELDDDKLREHVPSYKP